MRTVFLIEAASHSGESADWRRVDWEAADLPLTESLHTATRLYRDYINITLATAKTLKQVDVPKTMLGTTNYSMAAPFVHCLSYFQLDTDTAEKQWALYRITERRVIE